MNQGVCGSWNAWSIGPVGLWAGRRVSQSRVCSSDILACRCTDLLSTGFPLLQSERYFGWNYTETHHVSSWNFSEFPQWKAGRLTVSMNRIKYLTTPRGRVSVVRASLVVFQSTAEDQTITGFLPQLRPLSGLLNESELFKMLVTVLRLQFEK